MKGGQPAARALCVAAIFILGGCAIGGGAGKSVTAPVAERDLLAEAARDVEKTKWRAPEEAPMLAWITGDKDDRFTKSDAVAYYVDAIEDAGGVNALFADADAKLGDAARFHAVAMATIDAPRVTARDVALVEECIQTLRQQREIYAAAASKLEHAGATIDDEAIDALQYRFREMVRALGKAADDLADRYEKDRTATLAAPSRRVAGAASDL